MANEAAWVLEARTTLSVGPAPTYTPEPDEMLIKVYSVAINPVDSKMQKYGIILEDYPAVLGCDGAGIVEAVGTDVQGFAPGDRVVALFDVIPPFSKAGYRRSAFQRYAVAKASLVSKIPDNLAYNDAVVLPLGLTTAADALFADDGSRGMGLMRPQASGEAKPNGQSVIVWGGSSSVGACAIQLLVSAGYQVGSVSGGKHLDMCRNLGAKHVFDRSRATLVEDVAKAYKNEDVAGLFCCMMTEDAMADAFDVYTRLGSGGKFGSVLVPEMPSPVPAPDGVEIRRANGSFMVTSDLGRFLWHDWVPAALANGSLQCLPAPLVFGQGLEQIQGALDRYEEGVSGEKVVVEIVHTGP